MEQCLEEAGFFQHQLQGRYKRLSDLKLEWDNLAHAPHAEIVASFEAAWLASLERLRW